MKLLAIARVLFGAAVVIAVLAGAIYAWRPSAHNSQASAQVARTTAAKTAFAPVTPLATVTPLPTPDTRPRVVDVSTGAVRTLDLGAGFAFEHLMSDGSLLASNGSGKLRAVSRDGRTLAQFSNNGEPALTYSSDSRYAAWSDGHGLKVYDADGRQITSSVPLGASFPQQLADGSLILCRTQQCGVSVLVGPDGTLRRTLAVPRSSIVDFPQARRVAWAAADGMHVYDPVSGSERTYPDVQWVVGQIAISPDAAHLAYGALTGDNAVHVRIVDLARGRQHDIYAGAPNARVDGLAFTDATNVTFAVYANPARPDLPGTSYTVNIDGSQLRAAPALRPWATCGPTCGLPPASDVGPGGIAFWCEAPPTGADQSEGCVTHLVAVDRAAGTVRDVFVGTGQSAPYAVSPDGKTLAVAVIGPKLTLHIITIADGSDRAYVVDGRVPFADVQWFPDGSAVLITGGGGV